MNSHLAIGCSFGYLALLFVLAHAVEKRLFGLHRLVHGPYVYALSLCVYCTAWTYYGSVGQAATGGAAFLAIYIGPGLMAPAFWLVLRKIIRICKAQRITSIADFISARYGKSSLLGGVVTVLCLLEAVPYTALQLKAIAGSLRVLAPAAADGPAAWNDFTLYLTLGLAGFVALFGTRRVDTTEQHAGMVGAVAFETVVKLAAFLAAGLFVTYGVFGGFNDLFARAARVPGLQRLFVLEPRQHTHWMWVVLLSALAVLLLPRQFQVGVVENTQEKHLRRAIWVFPLYLLVMTVFVLPIAVGGRLVFGDAAVDADTYVLALPLHFRQHALALLVYIGGFSAATGMLIVTTIALSIMVSNNLVMPLAAKSRWVRRRFAHDFVPVLLYSRRISILLLLLLAYAYVTHVAGKYPLVSTGLVAFAAVAQFAPAVLGGVFWKRGSRNGTLAGLLAGFAVWLYTLVLPSVAEAGLLPAAWVAHGPWGLAWLRPEALGGLGHLDPLSHAMTWSLSLNTALYVGFSLFGRQHGLERSQAELFVDIFRHSRAGETAVAWKGTAYIPDIESLLARFLGKRRGTQAVQAFCQAHGIAPAGKSGRADPRLVAHAEQLLAGAIGAAAARILVASVVKDEQIGLGGVVHILRESQQLMRLNKELQHKSAELRKATRELQAANQRLTQSDALKDEFLGTVTHELRTPVTAIRAFSEILLDNPDLDEAQRRHFLTTITKETARMSRLIAQVLDLEKYESGRQVLQPECLDMAALVNEAVDTVAQWAREKQAVLCVDVPPALPAVPADRDRILQVLLNLLSNAIKFCDARQGRIQVSLREQGPDLLVTVADNGPGIAAEDGEQVFNKFYQISRQQPDKPVGSGLGLSISRRIVELHRGRIWLGSGPGLGATFHFTLPLAGAGQPVPAAPHTQPTSP